MPCPHCGHALELLTVRDVCELMQVSHGTLYGLIHAGRFRPPMKVGRQSRWLHEDIAAYHDHLKAQPRELAPAPFPSAVDVAPAVGESLG